EMALFFADFRLTGMTDCYSRLIATLARFKLISRSSFVILNYECLAEMACTNNSFGVAYCESGRGTNDVLVLKPHGSCNFLPGLPVKGVTFERVRYYYDGPLQPVDPAAVAVRYGAGETIPPAMSLFAPGKEN